MLPRQRIEGDYHHCNLHLSCLQEPAAHLCSSKMDGNWTFHCWTVFKWLTDVKLLNLLPLSNTYKDPGLLIISAKRLMSRSRRAVPPVKPRHWTVIYICFTSHCFIWSEFIALQHNTTIRRLIQSLLRKYQKIYEWSKRCLGNCFVCMRRSHLFVCDAILSFIIISYSDMQNWTSGFRTWLWKFKR